MRHFPFAILALSLAVAGACGGDDATVPFPPGHGAAGPATAGGHDAGGGGSTVVGRDPPADAPVPRFVLAASGAPRFADVPFPSDAYRDADGTLVDHLPGLSDLLTANADAIEAAYGTQNGFGTSAGVYFPIDDPRGGDGAIDRASLPADEAASVADGASAFLLDLETGAAVPSTAIVYDQVDRGSVFARGITIRPPIGAPLAEKHRYAAVLTSGAKSKSGVALGRSAALDAIARGARTGPIEGLYGDAFDLAVKARPALADSLVAITPYTTLDLSGELATMRGLVHAGPPPALSWDPADVAPMAPAVFVRGDDPTGATATLDQWLGTPDQLPDGGDDPAWDQAKGLAHDALAVVGTAVFSAPNFLRYTTDYSDPIHATVGHDASGQPVVDPDHPTNKIWVTIALPKSPMPESGFPLVLVQHGLGGDRAFLMALANVLAKQGYATAAIEQMTFGARASEPAYTKDAHAYRAQRKSWGGSYDGPDGFVDQGNGPIDFFANFLSLNAIRDQFRHSALDCGTAVDVLVSPSVDFGPLLRAVPGARIDPTRVGYVGDSLSGIIGAIVAGIDPTIRTFVLNVAGGGLVPDLVVNSPDLAGLVGGAIVLNFGISGDTPLPPGHPIVQLFQHVIDGGDPLLFAPHVTTSPLAIDGVANPKKRVIQIEALWDEIVSNPANEALARAAGLGLAQPNAGTMTGVALPAALPNAGGVITGFPDAGATAVLVQASPATHGSDLYSRHGSRGNGHPFAQFDTSAPFPPLAKPISIDEPYLQLQSMMNGFFASAFAGGAGDVAGFPTPVLDFDQDGTPDAADSAPEDPSVH